MQASRPNVEPNPGFGHVTGCEIVRVEGEAGVLELLRCAPSCPHGEVYLPRPEQASWFERGRPA
jgi:hypothetical protein